VANPVFSHRTTALPASALSAPSLLFASTLGGPIRIVSATSPASTEAITLLAQTEGIFLDPVYTAKAMAALIDHVRRGLIPPSETVLFLHTGGTPALFPHAGDFASSEADF
jgi:threonine synthase